MSEPSVTKALLFALQDSLMLLAPPGWVRCELSVALTPHGPRITALEAKGEGGQSPPPRPGLGVDPQEEAVRFSEGLGELVQHVGKPWTPGRLVSERTGGAADWKLLNADGSVAWFNRLDPKDLGQLLFTDELFALITGTEKAFGSLQRSLESQLGSAHGSTFDLGAGVLHLRAQSGKTFAAKVVPIGRYDKEHFTWAWSWADADVPPETAEPVKRICAPDARQNGLSALWRDHFHADEGVAWALAAHLVVSLGARGLLRWDDGSSTWLLAVNGLE